MFTEFSTVSHAAAENSLLNMNYITRQKIREKAIALPVLRKRRNGFWSTAMILFIQVQGPRWAPNMEAKARADENQHYAERHI